MSSAAVVPPPNSSSMMRTVPRLTAQARALLTTMNLHFAGVAALLVLDLYLIVHLVIVGQALRANNADAMDSQRAALRAAEIAAKPLRGLDSKLLASTADADKFYATRLPYGYAEVAAELGALTKKENVKLTRVQYTQDPQLSGTAALTEVKMDASVSGDYRPVVQFINAVERDKKFFVINRINLTGQQTGQVNLRINLTTYLRDPNAAEMKIETPLPDEPAEKTGGAQ